MLPDVSKRRKLRGFARKSYDSDQLHLILEGKYSDGYTTKNCVEIIKRMNVYWDESRYLVIESSTIFYLMKDLLEGNFADSDCEILKLYADNIDRGLLGRSMKNVMKMIKSIAAQRNLLKGVKKVIKVNRISNEWEDLLNHFLDDLENRLKYLSNAIMPANVEVTPLGAYMDYLAENHINIYDDIRLFVDNSGVIFDTDDSSVMIYKDHVIRVLSELNDTQIDSLLQKARHAMDLRNKRIEKVKDSIAAEKSASLSAAMEQYETEVLNLCSVAGKLFRKNRTVSANHMARSFADVYLIAAANVDFKLIGYLRRAGRGKFSISNINAASTFTEEEARKAIEIFKSKGPHRIAEMAKVELYSYGIGL